MRDSACKLVIYLSYREPYRAPVSADQLQTVKRPKRPLPTAKRFGRSVWDGLWHFATADAVLQLPPVHSGHLTAAVLVIFHHQGVGSTA